MKPHFEPIPDVIRVPLPEPFERFSVLVVPDLNATEGMRTFFLICDGIGDAVYMFDLICDDNKEAAALAIDNAPDYIDPARYY